MLPDVIVIGAMKCGTSSLHQYLGAHPDVSMSEAKELDFFIAQKNWKRGLDWYKEQFAGDALILGESSPNYTMYPTFKGVTERMHGIVPNAKLIYVVRDPIERLKSHYLHQWYAGRKNQTLEETLKSSERAHYVATSLYYRQIEQFLKYYSASQLLVLTVEQLKFDRDNTMRRVFQFLGLNPDADMRKLDHEYHRTSDKVRLEGALAFLQSKSPIAETFRRSAKFLLPAHFLRKAGQALSTKPNVDLAGNTVDSLRQEFSGDIQDLRKFTGLKLDTWQV